MSDEKPFNPLDTARVRLDEMRRGQLIPSGAVSVGIFAGVPLSQLVLEALAEGGVQIGPKGAALIAIAVSALSSYLTRDGRRFLRRK